MLAAMPSVVARTVCSLQRYNLVSDTIRSCLYRLCMLLYAGRTVAACQASLLCSRTNWKNLSCQILKAVISSRMCRTPAPSSTLLLEQMRARNDMELVTRTLRARCPPRSTTVQPFRCFIVTGRRTKFIY